MREPAMPRISHYLIVITMMLTAALGVLTELFYNLDGTIMAIDPFAVER